MPEAPALRDGKCDGHRGSQPRRVPPSPYLPPEVRRGARRHRLASIPAAPAARSRRRRRPERPRRLLRSRGGHGRLKWRRPERLRRLREARPIVRRDSREGAGLLLTGSASSQSKSGAAAGLRLGGHRGEGSEAGRCPARPRPFEPRDRWKQLQREAIKEGGGPQGSISQSKSGIVGKMAGKPLIGILLKNYIRW